jgi:hypothetical protein
VGFPLTSGLPKSPEQPLPTALAVGLLPDVGELYAAFAIRSY